MSEILSYNVEEIVLDFTNRQFITVPLIQYERNSRQLKIYFTDNGNGFSIPMSGVSVMLNVTKPDGTIYIPSCTPQEDGSVLVTIGEQLTAVVGKSVADVTITDGGRLYKTVKFYFYTNESATKDSDVESHYDFSAYNDQILSMQSSVNRSETATANCESATTATIAATTLANAATDNANAKATLANDKATLANTKAILADEKATLANAAATNATTVYNNIVATDIVTFVPSTSITIPDTSIVYKSDIVDNLTSTYSSKPLSSNMGKILNDSINSLTGEFNSKILTELVAIGDSYSTGYQGGVNPGSYLSNPIPKRVATKLGLNLRSYGVNGAGYAVSGIKTFLEQLQDAVTDTSFQNNKVKYVVIFGGRNDTLTGNDLITAVKNTYDYAKSNFVNAELIICPMWDFSSLDITRRKNFTDEINVAHTYCGVRIATRLWDLMIGQPRYYTDNIDIHPNETGAERMANAIVSLIHGQDVCRTVIDGDITYESSISDHNVNYSIENGNCCINGTVKTNASFYSPSKLCTLSDFVSSQNRFSSCFINDGNNLCMLQINTNGELYLMNSLGTQHTAGKNITLDFTFQWGI